VGGSEARLSRLYELRVVRAYIQQHAMAKEPLLEL